jgi:hypothetical protein
VGPHGPSGGRLVPRHRVMGWMRRQMHQRDLARHATSGIPVGGGVSAENIRALNEAFRTAMTGDRVFLTAGVDALSSDVKASYPGHPRGVHPRQ